MKEKDVIDITRKFISKKFPKRCSSCGKVYTSLSDYLRNTTHMGKPISYDADVGDWQPIEPIGTFSLANCSCGSTLSIDSKGMNLITMWRLMHWARKETKKRNIEIRDLLDDLRNKIDESVFQDENQRIEN